MTQAILVRVVRAYQCVLSPLTGNCCRFYPCCSSYAISAIQQHGCVKGLVLTVSRILRCNPCFSGGLDPVPEPSPPTKK